MEICEGGSVPGSKGSSLKWRISVICISNSNMKETMCNVGVSSEKITMIYHGFETPNLVGNEKDQIVITVGRMSEENLLRKGLKLFIDAARSFPNIPFICVGAIDNGIKEKIEDKMPLNVTLTGWVSDEELEDYFRRAKVYVQASMHEGFGCSVAEGNVTRMYSSGFGLLCPSGGSWRCRLLSQNWKS